MSARFQALPAAFLTEIKRSTEEKLSDLTLLFPPGFEFPLKFVLAGRVGLGGCEVHAVWEAVRSGARGR
jgi:hypothetical protein